MPRTNAHRSALNTIVPFALLAAAVFGLSCASLNTLNMPPRCADSYNACLNGCPPIPQGDLALQSTPCVGKCNEAAKLCK